MRTRHPVTPELQQAAAQAAQAAYNAGASPRAQVDAARAILASTGANLTYKPHQSLKERNRRVNRLFPEIVASIE